MPVTVSPGAMGSRASPTSGGAHAYPSARLITWTMSPIEPTCHIVTQDPDKVLPCGETGSLANAWVVGRRSPPYVGHPNGWEPYLCYAE